MSARFLFGPIVPEKLQIRYVLRRADLPAVVIFQTSSSCSSLKMRTRMGERRPIPFPSIAFLSASGTGNDCFGPRYASVASTGSATAAMDGDSAACGFGRSMAQPETAIDEATA